MVRRVRSSFELEVFDQSSSGLRRLEEFLDVYVRHLTPKHRTESNQLIHFLRDPLEGRRIIYFGLTFRERPCGFCALMYYPASRIGIFDFIVIAPTARGHGAYFAFADLISEYLEQRRISADYFIAEIISDDGISDSLSNPVALVRLLRIQGFRRARITYHAPDPSMVDSLRSCRSSLMVASNHSRENISAVELLRIVDLIYFNHYLLWFKPLLDAEAGAKYDLALRDERARLAQRANAHDPIVLNGMKDADVRLEHRSERHRASLIIFLTASAAIGLVAAVSPGALTGWIFVVLAALVLLLAIFSRRFRRLILKIFDPSG